jgi:alpha-1,2-mannosyltransferase
MRNRWNTLAWSILGIVFAGMALYLILNPTRTGVVPNYRFASTHWWISKSMYPGGTHGFLYLPQFAVLFTPFNLIQPPVLGEILWRAMGFGLFGFALLRLAQIVSPTTNDSRFPSSQHALAFFLIVLLAVPASLASINNGQTNLTLSACLVLTILAIRDREWATAGVFLTFCLVLKPLALAPWLLAFAVFPSMRIPLLCGVPALLVIGMIHPNPSYAWSQWVEFGFKLLHSYTPVNLRVSDIFGMLEKAGIPNNLSVNSSSRALGSFAALAFVWIRFRRKGLAAGSWALAVVTVLILTIFNPRAETNSYVLVSPLLAYVAVNHFLQPSGTKLLGWILSVVCLGLMCDGMSKTIYLATDVWLKPLLVTLSIPMLLPLPNSWREARSA